MSEEMKMISDELLVKYMLEECSDAERVRVMTWLETDEENKKYYQHFLQIWNESKALNAATEIDTDAAWLRMKGRMLSPKKGFRYFRPFFMAAAGILLLIGMLSWYHATRQKPREVITPEYTVVPEMIQSLQKVCIDTLSDNSVVTLNKQGVLRYPKAFAANERRVKLEGEAFFNITPDRQKPFFIDTRNDVEIRVVGTSFNVKSFDAYTEVIVETGIVEVRKFNRVVMLHPHEKARIEKDDSSIVVEKNKDKLYRYFRSREFECDNTPLWKVVEVLNEAYGDSVIIGRDDLKKLTLTSRFDNESLESILEVISETFEIRVEKKGNKYILK